MSALKRCRHCGGSGECDQVCCTTFGNARRAADKIIYVCMVCRGTGKEQQR